MAALGLLLVACGSEAHPDSASSTRTSSVAASPTPGSVAAQAAPRLYGAAIAYDTARSQLVLFGTVSAETSQLGPKSVTAETWVRSSGRWSKLTPTNSPPPRTYHGMVYDEARRQVVLFGGQSIVDVGQGLPALQDTWTWDGRAWSQRTPATSPPAAVGPILTYHAQLGRVVALINVFQGDNQVNQTWTWDGDTWAQAHPSIELPGPRFTSAAAYDAAHGSVVVFGRTVCTGPFQCTDDADTWTFDGKTWSRHPAGAGGPPGRLGATMAYDPSAERIVMFGGASAAGTGANFLSDTWTWDGAAWAKAQSVDSPSARTGAIAAGDTSARQVVLYGGYWSTQSSGSVYYDVWTWERSSWTMVQPSTIPAPSEQRDAILKAASVGTGLRPDCTAAPPPCMSVRGQPQLGFNAAYVVYDFKPPDGATTMCVSYVSYVNPDSYTLGPWHQVGVVCGTSDARMPQLGGLANVVVSGCANVRTYPESGAVLSCLPSGTLVTIDDGPVAIYSATPKLWWHLQHRGWIAHELLGV